MSKNNWIGFWMSTKVHSGWVRSREEWVKIVNGGFCGSLNSLLRLKSHRSSKSPSFGKGRGYTEYLNLGTWAKNNDIDLTV